MTEIIKQHTAFFASVS